MKRLDCAPKAHRWRALAIVLALLVSGCGGQLRYLTQASVGQEELNRRGIAISEIVEGQHLDKRTRELLAQVAGIKAFGEENGLRHTKNYERYVWLKGPAVVWVVSACHPLAFRPKTWTFPITGSITYRGWFDKEEAKADVEELKRQGWDVDMRASQAYSTLGWFDDPIVSTMLTTGDEAIGELADVVLHETLHATFYVPGQSTLNESVASFYGHSLAMKYLEAKYGPDSKELRVFASGRRSGEARGQRMKKAYGELEELYKSKLPREEKLAEKQRITDELRRDIKLSRPVTNATLIQYKTYGSGREEMEALFEVCGRDHKRMLAALEHVREITKTARPHTDPGLLLKPLLGRGCAP